MRIFIFFLFPTFVWAGTWRDDFNDGDFQGWKETWMKQNQTIWKVESGVLIGENPSNWGAYLVIGDAGWQDYEVECDARIVAIENSIPSFAIAMRHNGQNGAATKTLVLGLVALANPLGPSGIYATYLANNDAFPRKIKAMTVELNRWYHLKAKVQGDLYELEVDGEKLISIHDKTLKSGMVGLEAHAGVNQYDNVIITGHDVPDFNPGYTPVEPASKLTSVWARLKRSH